MVDVGGEHRGERARAETVKDGDGGERRWGDQHRNPVAHPSLSSSRSVARRAACRGTIFFPPSWGYH